MERKHTMDHKPVLLKQAANKQELRNWENILITKNKDHIINFEILLVDHLTKKKAADQLLQELQTNISRSWVDNEDKVCESVPHVVK